MQWCEAHDPEFFERGEDLYREPLADLRLLLLRQRDPSGIKLAVHSAPDSQWRKLSWWQQPDTRRLTVSELQKLGYIMVTGQYH